MEGGDTGSVRAAQSGRIRGEREGRGTVRPARGAEERQPLPARRERSTWAWDAACGAAAGGLFRSRQSLWRWTSAFALKSDVWKGRNPTFCLTGFPPSCCCKRGSGRALWERRGKQQLHRTFTNIQSFVCFPSGTTYPAVTPLLPQVQPES